MLKRLLIALLVSHLIAGVGYAQSVPVVGATASVSATAATEYDQGTAATDTDKLGMIGCVRADTAAAATGVADGDRARCIVDATGKLWVRASELANIESHVSRLLSGSLPVAGGAATATTAQAVGGTYNETPPTLTDGQQAGLQLTADGFLRAVVEGLVALSAQVTGGTPGTLTDVLLRHGCVRDDATSTLDASHADDDWTPCRVNARGELWVALGTSLSAAIDSVEAKGGNANPIIACNQNTSIVMTTATTTSIVATSGSTVIYVCSYAIHSDGGTATNVKFVDGTTASTACDTSSSDRSGILRLTAAGNTVGIARGSGLGMILKTSTAGDALCVNQTGAANITVDISYAQY